MTISRPMASACLLSNDGFFLFSGRPAILLLVLQLINSLEINSGELIMIGNTRQTVNFSTHVNLYTAWPKKTGTLFLYALTLYALTSSDIDRFSNIFHCLNHDNICNNTNNKEPTTPQVCRYTALSNVSVLKATIENKTASVTTYFFKVTTGNNMFIVSIII